MGRPLLSGDDLDKQVQAYITCLTSSHFVVNTAIILAVAEGIVKGIDSSLLVCKGGSINLTRHWATSLMRRMGLSKGKATIKSTLSQYDVEKVRT